MIPSLRIYNKQPNTFLKIYAQYVLGFTSLLLLFFKEFPFKLFFPKVLFQISYFDLSAFSLNSPFFHYSVVLALHRYDRIQ